DAAPHADARAGDPAAAAAAGGHGAAEAALRAPGRIQSTTHHRAWQRPRPGSGRVPALSGTIFPGCFQTRGDAVADRVSKRGQPVRCSASYATVSLWRDNEKSSTVAIQRRVVPSKNQKSEAIMSNKGQLLQDPFLNTLRK